VFDPPFCQTDRHGRTSASFRRPALSLPASRLARYERAGGQP
jgi:hypothetical protein